MSSWQQWMQCYNSALRCSIRCIWWRTQRPARDSGSGWGHPTSVCHQSDDTDDKMANDSAFFVCTDIRALDRKVSMYALMRIISNISIGSLSNTYNRINHRFTLQQSPTFHLSCTRHVYAVFVVNHMKFCVHRLISHVCTKYQAVICWQIDWQPNMATSLFPHAQKRLRGVLPSDVWHACSNAAVSWLLTSLIRHIMATLTIGLRQGNHHAGLQNR